MGNLPPLNGRNPLLKFSHPSLIFPQSRLRKAFKVSMPALGEGGWAETQFEDCSLEEMWTKMCRWVLTWWLLHIVLEEMCIRMCSQDRESSCIFHFQVSKQGKKTEDSDGWLKMGRTLSTRAWVPKSGTTVPNIVTASVGTLSIKRQILRNHSVRSTCKIQLLVSQEASKVVCVSKSELADVTDVILVSDDTFWWLCSVKWGYWWLWGPWWP